MWRNWRRIDRQRLLVLVTLLTASAALTLSCSPSRAPAVDPSRSDCVVANGKSVVSGDGIYAGPFDRRALAGWSGSVDGGYKFWVASHDSLPEKSVARIWIESGNGTVRDVRPLAHTSDYRSFFPGVAHLKSGHYRISVRLGRRSTCFLLHLSG